MKPIAKMTKAERAAILRDPEAKLSDLLEIAALDAIALQKQKRVRFNMDSYVSPPSRRGETCSVCLAGAALFRDLGIRDAEFVSQLPSGTTGNMMRIDRARTACGTVDEFRILERVIEPAISRKLCRAPFRTYLKAAQELRKAGL